MRVDGPQWASGDHLGEKMEAAGWLCPELRNQLEKNCINCDQQQGAAVWDLVCHSAVCGDEYSLAGVRPHTNVE